MKTDFLSNLIKKFIAICSIKQCKFIHAYFFFVEIKITSLKLKFLTKLKTLFGG